MDRTGAEPILDEAGGELARETNADVYWSTSDPPSPGVSGRLLEEMLGLLERAFAVAWLDDTD